METFGRVIAVEFPWNWVIVAGIVAIFVVVGLVGWWQSAQDRSRDSHGQGGGTAGPSAGGGNTH